MWNEVLESLVVVKRSGQRVEFNASKIAVAIKKAFDAVYGEPDESKVYKVFERVLSYINDTYKDRKTINVEDIQDIIENILKEEKFQDVYSSFRDYRQKRAASRKVFSEKQHHKFIKVIERVEEESGSYGSNLIPSQILNKFGKIVSSEYAKAYVLDTKFVRALEEGNIYIHNLEYFSLGYISHLNLKLDLKYDDEYLEDMLSEIINSQSEVSCEIGINSIDVLLEKYILNNYKSRLKNTLKKYLRIFGLIDFVGFKKIEEIINRTDDIDNSYEALEPYVTNDMLKHIFRTAADEAVEEIGDFINTSIYRIFNTLKSNSRDGKVFTISVSSENTVARSLIRDAIISYLADTNYLDSIHVVFKVTPELNDAYLTKIVSLIINKKNISLAFTENSYNGGNYSAEYFSNGSRVFENVNDNENRATGRMVVARTSINLARLGLKHLSKDRSNFYDELDQVLELTKNELVLSFETIGNKNKENYKMLFNGNILGDERLEPGQKIRKIIKTGNLSIGLIGLKECVLALEPDSSKQYKLLIDILSKLNERCEKFSEETKLNFNIFEPSDRHSRKHMIGIDKSIYGKTKNISDKDMYDLIDSAKFITNYNDLAYIQKQFKGGNLVTIDMPASTTNKKIVDLIKKLIDSDMGFVKIKVGTK